MNADAQPRESIPEKPDDLIRVEQVFAKCSNIMKARQHSYGSQWKKYGWRGALYSARRKVERAWAQLWDAEPMQEGMARDLANHDTDDLHDTINYLAMAIIAVEDGNRDGTGGWWE